MRAFRGHETGGSYRDWGPVPPGLSLELPLILGLYNIRGQ